MDQHIAIALDRHFKIESLTMFFFLLFFNNSFCCKKKNLRKSSKYNSPNFLLQMTSQLSFGLDLGLQDFIPHTPAFTGAERVALSDL